LKSVTRTRCGSGNQAQPGQLLPGIGFVGVVQALHAQATCHLHEQLPVVNVHHLAGGYLRYVEGQAEDVGVGLAKVHVAGRKECIE
jgi:hypothetical protein